MKNRLLSISLITSFVILAGCDLSKKTAKKPDGEHITLDTVEVHATKAEPVYRASATKVWQIEHTRIALNFDWEAQTADAREWISLHPYFYPTDTICLDAKGMRIDSVVATTKNRTFKPTFVHENNELKIYLGQVCQAADSVELYLKYTAQPYSVPTGGSRAISEDRGLYFINTGNQIPGKPAEIWTQGESESNSHWMVTIDKPNSRFTTQVELTVPDSMTTLSNGALVQQISAGGHMRTDIWKMDMPIQAYVVMFAIGKYKVVQDRWRGKEVNYYVEPAYEPYAREMFKNTPEMLEYYSKVTGVAYPWNKYSQVVARDYISGAMENTSAALFGEFMNRNAREMADYTGEDVVAHELFHEWFGDYVTCESWSNLTVNESFANFGEQLWRRHKYGDASADELAYNDLQRYLYTSRYHDPQLVRFYYDANEAMFDGITYNKGGAILHYLQTLIGAEAFSRAMQLYLTHNALHAAEAHDWRKAVEEATGQDWNWFFNQWYYHAGHPILNISYEAEAGGLNASDSVLRVIVKQDQQDGNFLYKLPLKAGIIVNNSITNALWNIGHKTDTFWYSYVKGIRPVIVPDIQHILPGEIMDKKSASEWLTQYRICKDYGSRRIAMDALRVDLSDSVKSVMATEALNDPNYSLRRDMLDIIRDTKSRSHQKRWGTKVVALAAGDSSSLVRAAAFQLLSAWRDTAHLTMIENACYDSSYAVAGAALEGVWKMDSAKGYKIAHALAPTHPRGDLERTCWTIIGHEGNVNDLELYRKFGSVMIGVSDRPTYLRSLFNYLKATKSDSVFMAALDLFVTQISYAGQKTIPKSSGNSLLGYAEDLKGNEAMRHRLDLMKPEVSRLIELTTDKELRETFEKKYTDVWK